MTDTPIYDLSKIDAINHHPLMDGLVDLLCHKTGNVNRTFFQAEVAYFLGLIPSAQRAVINSPERGIIPINIYAIALAQSGFGKGHSVNTMEQIISVFRDKFMRNTMPEIAEESLRALASDMAASAGLDEDAEYSKLQTEYAKAGNMPFIFDSGTGPAVKQLRYKLLLAKAGAINFQMDEIGSNLVGNTEVVNTFLELYDLGKIKAKLIKNTSDNERGIDIVGTTPANALLFGTSSKLLDGSRTEEEFFSFLETGYARRCIFGLGSQTLTPASVDPAALYQSLINKSRAKQLIDFQTDFAMFADISYYGREIAMPEEVGIELLTYRLFCEQEAELVADHQAIHKAELSHRYFKALKLAGVYAFLDDATDMTVTHLQQAIKVIEESGKSFHGLLNRERNFVRLAKYIADAPDNITHADLVEDLPYYPSSSTPRREIMDLAMAWATSNHVVIKKDVISGVEFFSGSKLKETDLDKLTFSYSNNIATGYIPAAQPLTALPTLLGADGMHWCNHTFESQHRRGENAIPGFNLIVVDVDGSISLDSVKELLKEYTFVTATTKRHTDETNRFRLIMPTNYRLDLSLEEYREFMTSFLSWLPFPSDEAAVQISKKWETLDGSKIYINQGNSLINILPFIPKTKQNAEYTNSVIDLGQLDNLERWFLKDMQNGNRNNNLLKYAMMLKDGGVDEKDIQSRVLTLNSKCPSPLKKDEIKDTVFKSLAQKMKGA